jgi:hypothetical protein
MRGVRGLIGLIAFLGLSFALLKSLLSYEVLLRVPIGDQGVLSIYAEPEFHYEPPGFLYCEVTRGDRIELPRRRFMSVGPERVPRGRLAVLTGGGHEIVAITLDGDVAFLYDLRSRAAWPGPYAETDQQNYAFAKEVLRRLQVDHPGLPCRGLVEYEQRQRMPPQTGSLQARPVAKTGNGDP